MSDRVITEALDDMENGQHVFVPAVMSVGVLFSMATLVRDLVTRSERRSILRRAGVDGRATADLVLGGRPTDSPIRLTSLRRTAAVVGALVIAAATYLVPGSIRNYVRPDGYVSDIAWILAACLVVAALLVAIGGRLLLIAVRWPSPPARTRPAARWLAALGLATRGEHPASRWDAVAIAAGALTTIVMLLVSFEDDVWEADARLAESLGDAWPASLDRYADLFGRTEVAVLLALLIGVSTLRCRPFVVTYLVSVAVAMGLANGVRLLVDRDRPPLSDVTGGSFPSGHMVQAVLFVGLVPLALRLMGVGRRKVQVVLGVLVVATTIAGIQRIADGHHWPTDVLAGATAALAIVAVARIVLARTDLHERCRGCPWQVGPP